MPYLTRITFGIDPKIHNQIVFHIKFRNSENGDDIFIEFDSGKKFAYASNRKINIPPNATTITLTSNDNIKLFRVLNKNPAIISIEHFESNTITDLSHAFQGFINVREFKHFNVTSKVVNTSFMCHGWKNFNGTIPESFCSIFEHLEFSSYMFYGWEKYNQSLPKGFCSNTPRLCFSEEMFSNWKSYNQPLPEGFFNNIEYLTNSNQMFYNWKSYNQPLPKGFFDNVRYLTNSNRMFSNWLSFNQPLPEGFFNNIEYLTNSNQMFYNWCSYEHQLPQDIIKIFNKLQNDVKDLCLGWIKNDKMRNGYNYEGVFIKDYTKSDIVYLIDNFYDKIQDLMLMSKLKNDTMLYCIENRNLIFIIHRGNFIFTIDVLIHNKTKIEILNDEFQNIINFGFGVNEIKLNDLDFQNITYI